MIARACPVHCSLIGEDHNGLLYTKPDVRGGGNWGWCEWGEGKGGGGMEWGNEKDEDEKEENEKKDEEEEG